MKRVNRGTDDLETLFPEIAKEWDYNKNEKTPSEILSRTSKKVWWKCKKGHEWQASIRHRTINNSGCPYCKGKSVTRENSFGQRYPDLIDEIHSDENDFDPFSVAPMSDKKIKWKCKKGHEWVAMIKKRSMGQKCPYCTNRRVYVGFNDLKTRCPEVANEWNYNRNIMKPEEILYGSNRIIWWKCIKGHEWRAKISNRVYLNNKCPYCANRKINPGDNDFKSNYANIAEEWNYEKNAKMPEEYPPFANSKVWWKCKLGHEWQANINSRTGRNNGCPYCSNRRVLTGYNDLETKCPELAEEWNSIKNNNVSASETCCAGRKKVWWICKEGHEWQATINDRVHKNTGCPYCAGQLPIRGKTDFETWCKENKTNLLTEWNYDRNTLSPDTYTAKSSKKVWWRCKEGHEWQAIICNRIKGNGCPYCSGQRVITGDTDLATKFPELLKEYSFDRNLIKPEQLHFGSSKKVWWKCEEGHEWRTAVLCRTKMGTGCPYC